ncbi:MAG: biopolymer transporter ExbD [Cytophagales bacterium]|nr:biopolymer transporter ExbD [Cytophagales bacterium]
MRIKKNRSEVTVSAGSMADIAFLLLIFFLVATTLSKDKGLMIQLPPDMPPTKTRIIDRNLFKIHINSANKFLIENEVRTNLEGLVDEMKEFVLNPSNSSSLAENPEKAIISIKTQRGTTYSYFIEILDLVKEAYYQMYGEKLGITSDQFRALDRDNPTEMEMYQFARSGLPMNISIAEPNKK